MCGIAGFLELSDGAIADPSLAIRMREAVRHRGPDDAGVYTAGPIALAHRRLSIIDLDQGHQPILSKDGTVALVFNGEIYNYRDLRSELCKRGHVFRTQSDTEVILHAYREFGPSFPVHLRGMFAIALWDSRSHKLMLVRDRLGIKPLFYTESRARIGFASEIKSLFELPQVDKEHDKQAIYDYFSFLYVPGPRTIYRHIRQVPPATSLIIDSSGIREERFWALDSCGNLRGQRALEAIDQALDDAVQSHLVADVPIGAFLSGGIDSGLIVASMARHSDRPIDTFTVYDPSSPRYDERVPARAVAQTFSTNHHELPAATNLRDDVGLVPNCFDEPFADSGAIANLVVCRSTAAHVKVALSGLGGDEISAGYVRYAGARLAEQMSFVPRTFTRLVSSAFRHLPAGRGLALHRLRRFADALGLEAGEAYARFATTGAFARPSIFSSPFLDQIQQDAPLQLISELVQRAGDLGHDPVNRLLFTDLMTYIPGDLLPLADRTSMRFGLEVRVPFLDHKLVETAMCISGDEKITLGRLKLLLRRLAKGKLPNIVTRGPKRGFSVPMDRWLRHTLRDALQHAITDIAPQTGIFSQLELERIFASHEARRENHEDVLWALLVFCRWLEPDSFGSA